MSDLVVHDVVIVGAGPVGLFLAIELETAGVQPLVVERLAEPDRGIKAAAIGAVGVEALARRGFAQALDEEQVTMPMAKAARAGAGPVRKPGGHFSALFVIDQDRQRDPERHSRMVPQEALERILTAEPGAGHGHHGVASAHLESAEQRHPQARLPVPVHRPILPRTAGEPQPAMPLTGCSAKRAPDIVPARPGAACV